MKEMSTYLEKENEWSCILKLVYCNSLWEEFFLGGGLTVNTLEWNLNAYRWDLL